jgi:UDP-N-acetylmuramoylalanine--D-glutamate ligase
MEEYATVKNKITQRQTKADICVLNYENEYTREIGKKCPAEVVYFSSARRLENGLYLEKDDIFLSEDGIAEKLMNIHEMRLVGICNVENVMAAIAITLAMGVPKNLILDTICQFQAVEHRIEYTATVNGVDFYNDSKGTNPDAAIQGIRAMDRPTILIGGGYDKQSAYDEWIEAFDHKVKLLVLIGQTREKIAACAEKHDFHAVMMADSFEQAFQICVEHADPGDAVLLSPACASWGMFPNYEVRGQLFKDMVHKLGQSVELKGE